MYLHQTRLANIDEVADYRVNMGARLDCTDDSKVQGGGVLYPGTMEAKFE
jgi:hypothetical protein